MITCEKCGSQSATAARLRDASLSLSGELELSIRQIVRAMIGSGEPPIIGYRAYQPRERLKVGPVEHEFYVIVCGDADFAAVVGKDGATAHNVRSLVRARAHRLGSEEKVNVRFVRTRHDAPSGVLWP